MKCPNLRLQRINRAQIKSFFKVINDSISLKIINHSPPYFETPENRAKIQIKPPNDEERGGRYYTQYPPIPIYLSPPPGTQILEGGGLHTPQ